MKQQKNLGWECPKCGRCYSPYKTECSYCSTSTYTSSSTNTSYMHSFQLDERSTGGICKICGQQEWKHPLFTNTI